MVEATKAGATIPAAAQTQCDVNISAALHAAE
jgi:hypothetical protein